MDTITNRHLVFSINPLLKRLPNDDKQKRGFAQRSGDDWKRVTMDVYQLCDHLSSGASIAPCLKDGKRNKEGFHSIPFMVFDFDTDTAPETVSQHPIFTDYLHIVGHTASSTPEHPKSRIILPLDRDIFSQDEYARLQQAVFPEIADLKPDTSSDSAVRFYFGFQPGAVVHQGRFLKVDDLQQLVDIQAPEKPSHAVTAPKNGHKNYVQAAFEQELSELTRAGNGNRNNTLNSAAYSLGQFVGAGELARHEVETALLNTALSIGLSEHEARATIASGLNAGEGEPRHIPEKKNAAPSGGERLSDAPQEAAHARFTLIPESELVHQKPIEWLVPNLIARGELCPFFGASGVGKTHVLLDIAFRVGQSETVVYVASEGQSGYPKRRAAWYQHHKKNSGKVHFVYDVVQLMNSGETDSFIEAVQALNPALIIFDTLAYAMAGGDENSAKDMGIVLANCQRIQRATGAAVVPVHHTGKSGASERGSSALRGAAYVMTEVKSSQDGYVTLECSKTKDEKPFDDIHYRLMTVITSLGESCVLMPSEKIVSDPNTLTHSERKILETLSLEVFLEAGAKAAQVIDLTNLSKGCVYGTLSALKGKGLIEQGAKGDPYTINGSGLLKIGKAQSVAQKKASPQSPMASK